MRAWLLIIALCVGLVPLVACKGVGTVCDQSGSTSQCGDGFICTFTRTPGTGTFGPNDDRPPPLSVCLRECTTSTDCGEGELCRFVYCSAQKSCQTGPLQDPPPSLCGAGGAGGAGGVGGVGGMGGAAGTGGTGGTGGTLACDSVARAYVQTLDPASGFNRTNNVVLDTTNLPDTWDRYSISLDLTDPLLEGQLLQFGFSATASNFAPSGVFYDNVLVETGTAAGGAGGAGGGGGVGGLDLVVEYAQDFESLDQASPTALGEEPDALWGEGWIVFGNAFEADGETLAYPYGPFPAPNNTGGFSGIDIGQGGPAQGDQQLIIISDYNNADQGIGRRIEANTFRERDIVAGDIGNTLVFSFDAKRGNINEGCPPPAEP